MIITPPDPAVFSFTPAWRSAYPVSFVGILAMREVSNSLLHPALQLKKLELEADLRMRWSGVTRQDLLTDPILQAYAAYYRRFDKTYHVQLQLESLVMKGRSLPTVTSLVDAMFMAEVDNLLLTAGHDLDEVKLPLVVDVAQGSEGYTLMRGTEQVVKAGDMYIRDSGGVLSSIIYGPANRAQITLGSRNVLYTVYAPPGINPLVVKKHLRDLHDNVLLIAPAAHLELLAVFPDPSSN